MKKIAILVLVVALLVGLVCIGLPSQTSAAKPLPPMPKGPGLVTIVEDHELGPEDVFMSDWMDVTSFRQFRLYAGLAKDDSYIPRTRVVVLESPLGVGDVSYGGIRVYGYETPDPWWPQPPDQIEWWGVAGAFDGLYSKIRVVARNYSGNATETVSLYLLMAEE